MATLSQEQEYLAYHHEQGEHKLVRTTSLLGLVGQAAGRATIRFPANQYYNVVPHARAFANAVYREVGADSFGTYGGHSPTPERALDIFSSIPRDRKAPETPGMDKVVGDDVAEFAVENMGKYGIDYVIWRQHIYNPEIAGYWRLMGDRGSITNNHFDHNHMSFNTTAGDYDEPTPPAPTLGDAMSLSVRYIWGGTDWVFDGPSHIHATGTTNGVLRACDGVKMFQLGKVDEETHRWFENTASTWRSGKGGKGNGDG